ncbi:hypothetical protein [Nocardiopsis changdeensis]|uniref:hypothetical protein n=1 Tax=Nocardiopsis changdeensis TaxID=2831969 RepID=UPI0021B0DC5A|nr:hypothetical protein [Nocardiopsis changdeensis]
MDVNASPPPAAGPSLRCPDCRSPLAAGSAACARCGLLLTGPLAQRLWEVDTEIGRADEHLRRLRSERSGLLHALRAASRRAAAVPPAAGPVPPAAHPAAVPAAAPHAAVPPRPDGEMRRRSAQNVILGLGGLLVGISALVFAIWTWSDMGTGTRALVLGATTLAFALVAVPLYRRGLQATAETFGVLAAALLGIDALALWLLMPERLPEGPGYSAGALAGIAALTALYPLLVPLRAPRIIAALAAQPVPLLLLFALPLDDPFPWILPVLAATGLADLVLARVTAPLGEHSPRRTLTVLSVVLAVLTTTVSALLVFAVTEADPPGWWGPALALLLSGATWLVLARDRANGRIAALPAVAALVLVPLAAGPAVLPVLPRPPAGEPWSLRSADVPAATVLGVDGPGTAWPESLPYLAAIAVGAALAAGVTALLRRDLLPTVAFLAAPPVLLAPPLLLGLPHPVAIAWALCLGGLLVLGTAAIPARPYAWASAAAGVATLVTALLWSAGLFWTFMAALPCVGLVALAALLLLRHRFPGFGAPAAPVPPGTAVPVPPGRVLYGAALALWAVGLPAWASAWAALGAGVMPAQGSWWTAAAILLSGVTALLLGRTSPRPATPGAPDARTAFTVFGLLLLPLALVLAPPGGALWSGGTSLEVWSAPPEVMLEPATEVLGTAVAVGPGTAAGLLVAGALAVALVGAVDRRWLLPAAALAAPPALVPLPVMLGAPFAVAVLWAAAVGALLALGAALVRDRLAWAPAVTGPLTLAAALYWSLPEQHTTLLVVLLSAGAALGCALLSRRAAAPRHPAEARALPPVPVAGPAAGSAAPVPPPRASGSARPSGRPWAPGSRPRRPGRCAWRAPRARRPGWRPGGCSRRSPSCSGRRRWCWARERTRARSPRPACCWAAPPRWWPGRRRPPPWSRSPGTTGWRRPERPPCSTPRTFSWAWATGPTRWWPWGSWRPARPRSAPPPWPPAGGPGTRPRWPSRPRWYRWRCSSARPSRWRWRCRSRSARGWPCGRRCPGTGPSPGCRGSPACWSWPRRWAGRWPNGTRPSPSCWPSRRWARRWRRWPAPSRPRWRRRRRPPRPPAGSPSRSPWPWAPRRSTRRWRPSPWWRGWPRPHRGCALRWWRPPRSRPRCGRRCPWRSPRSTARTAGSPPWRWRSSA